MSTIHLHTSESTMPTHSVLLLRSHHCNWVGLRTILEEEQDLGIVGEVMHADEIMPTVRRLHPDVIFTPVKLEGTSIIPHIAQVRIRWPEIKLIVLGDEPEHHELMTLGHVGIDGYLLWNSLSPLVLHHCLGAVLEAGLWIGDSAAVAALVTPPSANRQVVLTTQQRAVLKRLAEGLTQQQTADTEHLSLRTVERTIEALKEKFDVTTTFALGVKAVCLGFVS